MNWTVTVKPHQSTALIPAFSSEFLLLCLIKTNTHFHQVLCLTCANNFTCILNLSHPCWQPWHAYWWMFWWGISSLHIDRCCEGRFFFTSQMDQFLSRKDLEIIILANVICYALNIIWSKQRDIWDFPNISWDFGGEYFAALRRVSPSSLEHGAGVAVSLYFSVKSFIYTETSCGLQLIQSYSWLAMFLFRWGTNVLFAQYQTLIQCYDDKMSVKLQYLRNGSGNPSLYLYVK